jgi:diacylglycerol O-acyltransferase
MIVEAGHSLATFYSGRWLGEIDVPTAVMCTNADRAVRPELQRRLCEAIPTATLHPVDDGHLACARSSFEAPLVTACLDVASRVRSR